MKEPCRRLLEMRKVKNDVLRRRNQVVNDPNIEALEPSDRIGIQRKNMFATNAKHHLLLQVARQTATEILRAASCFERRI